MRNVSQLQLVAFFGLTFAITWSALIPAVHYVPEAFSTPLIVAAAFGPMLAAIIVLGRVRGVGGLKSWLLDLFVPSGHWWMIGVGFLLLPLVFGSLHFLFYSALGGRPDFSDAYPAWSFPIAMLLTAALTGGNEEPGWRGFAAPALSALMHPVLAAVVLGVIHSAWHLPIMDSYGTDFVTYTFNVTGLTIILNWFWFRSRGCVIPVMLAHAGTNVIGRYLPTPDTVLDGDGSFMVLRGIVYWVLALAIIVATRGTLGFGYSK
jgi:membrane protease YdiL (CAAX protease family)